jgi:hypothetical protein
MRKLLKTPGRFCDMLVLLCSLKIHLDQLYQDAENGATETGTVSKQCEQPNAARGDMG